MKLSSVLASDFNPAVRQRGQNYFRSGWVRVARGSDTELVAKVNGAGFYGVEIRWKEGEVEYQCECPYFGSTDNCKHLWAAVLTAESKGFLQAAVAGRGTDPALQVAAQPPAPKPPDWRRQLGEVVPLGGVGYVSRADAWPDKREVLYAIDVAASLNSSGLVLDLLYRDRKLNGEWSKTKELKLTKRQLGLLPETDRQILATLFGGQPHYSYSYSGPDQFASQVNLLSALAGLLVPRIAETGRCRVRPQGYSDSLTPVEWDDGGAWQFQIEMRPKDDRHWTAEGVLRRGEERLGSAETVLVAGGLVVARGRVAPLQEGSPVEWVAWMRRGGRIEFAADEKATVLAALLEHSAAPPVDAPEELRYETVSLPPRPGLRLRKAEQRYGVGQDMLRAEMWFDYGGRVVKDGDAPRGVFEAESRRYLRRDLEAEEAARSMLAQVGLRYVPMNYYDPKPGWELSAAKLPKVVRLLVEAGWRVEAEGKTFRSVGSVKLNVKSGVDWFEMHGGLDFSGEAQAGLPELLEAVRRGESMVRLDDGTYGFLPEEWLERLGLLASAGTAETGHVRFGRTQVGLLDALLAAQPEIRYDEAFARARERLRSFEGVKAAEQPEGFVGELRGYQREGLGWMQFLREFGFGGCLADDMGVGKTAQVLALLEARREAADRTGPSLAVVPRSLVFNWKQEAARFTPGLRVLDHTGTGRSVEAFGEVDLVLTTYGTLRKDAAEFKDVEFDAVILDEAQAIKNAATESAKAARLLRGRQRLALSGTPVENHLGELWSLFEFLNPGMWGASSVLQVASGAMRNPSDDARRLLARALRPFILRRTKAQVARELPPKLEQTIYCEMEPKQRKLYDQLRQHYRGSLLQRVESQGLAKSKMHVLEALLRLRQAACHPGLLDPKKAGDDSAKLDALGERLQEVLEGGHKALVFSQFTSLLGLLRTRLDAQGVTYEYLDGRTRNREAKVKRFQEDPACPLFLISLKAGGLGLNLTAAEYVFLLDPWWNPAVEAQAVDRAHRIGQQRQVFAYRLITKGTVEEGVLELQKGKKALADAIVGGDGGMLREMTREDLELLLG